MTEPQVPSSSAAAVPAADVVAPAGNVGPIVHQSFPLRQPEDDVNEIIVGVRGKLLKRIRKQIGTLVTAGFPWPEVLLGIATLSFGGFLGAAGSSLPWASVSGSAASPTLRSVLFYVAMPVVGAAAAVGFLCIRHFSARSAADVARAVLEELPDPDRTLQPPSS